MDEEKLEQNFERYARIKYGASSKTHGMFPPAQIHKNWLLIGVSFPPSLELHTYTRAGIAYAIQKTEEELNSEEIECDELWYDAINKHLSQYTECKIDIEDLSNAEAR